MYTNILTTFVAVIGSAYLFFREADEKGTGWESRTDHAAVNF